MTMEKGRDYHTGSRGSPRARGLQRLAFALLLAGVIPAANAADAGTNSVALADYSIEDLVNIQVRSVSRRAEPVSQAAAAIHVITQEDIRRSGATTIAEALRMAPGLNVARINSHSWAVSARGFNDFFANKLLVLMDGRSVYTPLFSGVFWDVQDTMLEDIERIEVIRGPGATLWGANAVNGVINIITKSSTETQGGLITGGTGTEEIGFGSIRYGGKINDEVSYRFYTKYFNRDESRMPFGGDASDQWAMFRTGFRTDWKPDESNELRLQGDYYTGEAEQLLPVAVAPPVFFRNVVGRGSMDGANVLGSWKHTFSEDSDLSAQVYYDRTERNDRVHREIRDTYDFDFQHRFAVGERQQLMWGLGYRYTVDELSDGRDNTGAVALNPRSQGDQLFSSFLQDEIVLVPERLRLTLGSKFEHNDYTGFELQPNARLLITPHEKHTVWAAVSRAVRTPARIEHSIQTWFLPFTQVVGNTAYGSEELIAYELGYRIQPIRTLSFDLAMFYNDYDDLRVFVPAALAAAPALSFWQPVNGMHGETYGAELSANWNVVESWRLSAGYTWLQMNLHADEPWNTMVNTLFAGPGVARLEAPERDSPQHQFHIRSYWDLPHNLAFDTAAYYVDNLQSRNAQSYVRLDARLGWRPTKNLEFSLVGQNLLDNQHPEFGSGFLINASEIERSAYVKVTWRF